MLVISLVPVRFSSPTRQLWLMMLSKVCSQVSLSTLLFWCRDFTKNNKFLVPRTLFPPPSPKNSNTTVCVPAPPTHTCQVPLCPKGELPLVASGNDAAERIHKNYGIPLPRGWANKGPSPQMSGKGFGPCLPQHTLPATTSIGSGCPSVLPPPPPPQSYCQSLVNTPALPHTHTYKRGATHPLGGDGAQKIPCGAITLFCGPVLGKRERHEPSEPTSQFLGS